MRGSGLLSEYVKSMMRQTFVAFVWFAQGYVIDGLCFYDGVDFHRIFEGKEGAGCRWARTCSLCARSVCTWYVVEVVSGMLFDGIM